MKICPQCSTSYSDDNLNFCLEDGVALEFSGHDPRATTVRIDAAEVTGRPVQAMPFSTPAQFASNTPQQPKARGAKGIIAWVSGIIIAVLLLCGGAIGGFLVLVSKNTSNIVVNEPNSRTVEPKKADKTPSSIPDDKGEYDLSMEKYNRIKIGTARDDVESILGGKGTEISSSEGGGMKFSVNKWQGEKYTSIILSFKNDKVMSRNQVGLK